MESFLRRVVRGKKGLAMADESRAFSSTDLILDDGDLLSWEIVDPSDDDEDDLCSYDSDGGFGSLSADLSANHALSKHVFDLHDDLVLDEHVRVLDAVLKYEPNDEGYGGDSFDDHDDDDDDDDDGYGEEDDLDDELVPKCVSDRFERQRMRKLGKRAYPKMNKSKRLPYYYNRPGCVYGKHGLGLKHSVI